MWLIVGLGNPGKKYVRTRHNLGFMVAEAAAARWRMPFSTRQAQAETAQGVFEDVSVLLAKPQTYMNRSGESVAVLLRRYELTPAHLIVVYDDLDLPVGRLRLRERGRAGGHRGVQSLIDRLQTDAFLRLRLGIAEADRSDDTVDYVLTDFSPAVQSIVDETVARAVQALETLMREGVAKAMSLFNR